MGGYQRMEFLKSYIQYVGVLEADKIQGYWQIWEEESDELSLVLGFRLESTSRKAQSVEKGEDEDPFAIAAKGRVLAQGPENTRDMVESWNLASSELWYFLKATQRRRKSERLEILGSVAF
jgi:hypothetical protein